MISQAKTQQKEKVDKIIKEALDYRIPFFDELRADDNLSYVCQSDLYGYIDTVIRMPSTKLYFNQNKSRSDGKYDICIECRSFRGNPQNLNTGQNAPIAGAYWSEAWQRWISPRFGMADTLTYYLPSAGFVGHFSRYYLEIMLAKKETWEMATGIHKKDGDIDTVIAFFDFRVFSKMYIETVKAVTYGDAEETGILNAKEPLEAIEENATETNNE